MNIASSAESSRGGLSAALTFACVMPTAIAWAYFVGLADPGSAQPNAAAQLTYTLGKVVQFAFPLLFLYLYERRRGVLGELAACARNPAGLALGIGFGIIVGVIILIAYQVRLHETLAELGTPARLRDKVVQLGVAAPARFIMLALFLSVLHSFLEEYYWRWFVFGRLREVTTIGVAVLISSLAFMSHHVIILWVYMPGDFWGAVVPFSLCIAVGGAFWAWLFQRSGSLLGPWLGHLLVDAAIMTAGYLMLF